MKSAITAEIEHPEVRYDRRTIGLHWITALLVALLWGIAEIIDLFPRGAPKIAVRSVHISLGVLLAVVLVRRLLWRVGSGQRLPPVHGGLLGLATRIVHVALYAALVVVVALGLVNAWARGDSIFSLFTIPKLLPGQSSLKPTIENFHKVGANALVILALVHALAGLFHRYILRDSVLQRMLLRRQS